MKTPWLEVKCICDRRYKLWVKDDDMRDPVMVISYQGNRFVPREYLDFINVDDPAEAQQAIRRTA